MAEIRFRDPVTGRRTRGDSQYWTVDEQGYGVPINRSLDTLPIDGPKPNGPAMSVGGAQVWLCGLWLCGLMNKMAGTMPGTQPEEAVCGPDE